MEGKRIRCIAFSQRGFALAQQIAEALGGEAIRSSKKFPHARGDEGIAPQAEPMNVQQWTRKYFNESDALIFVGAAGIAVRAVAPYVQDKTTDPAVVVIDERALHVIPLLSGHLGGANDLARRIAHLTGSDCVITTATDVNGVFAVDEWSKHQNCSLLEKEKIMHISGRLLAGDRVTVYSPWEITGEVPEGIDVIPPEMDPYAEEWDAPEEPGETDAWEDKYGEPDGEAYEGPDLATEKAAWPDPNEIDISLDIEVIKRRPLHLIPQICVLGVGCRRGTSAETIEERLLEILELTGVHPAAICAVASIDLKKDEPGLTSFCERHGWPLIVYSTEELQQAEGDFTPSAFVSSITGVDNVCERSAVLAAGNGELIQKKLAVNGVTMAMAMKEYRPDWTWQEE